MAKLYELTESYRNVWELVDDETIDLEVVENTLQSLEGAIEEKAANIAIFIRGLDADVDAIKTEEQRLAKRRKAIENRRDGIKQYIKNQMEAMGIDKIKTATQTIALQNNPPAVQVLDQSKIPAQYITVIPEQYSPDKKKIAEDLKAGVEVPGCELTRSKSLRIR